MKKIILLVIMVLFSFTVSSCNPNYDPFRSVESGDFIYATNKYTFGGEEGEVSIIGLTDQGQQKEVLVFPSTIDGYKVVSIGATSGLKYGDYLKIYNAKKVYFSRLYYGARTHAVGVSYRTEKKLEIFFTGFSSETNNFNDFLDSGDNNNTITYFDQGFVNFIYEMSKNKYNIKPANLTYYIEKDTPYFIDFVNNTTVTVIPPNPHKDGYKFEGWYKDITFKERWNFNKDIVPTYKIEYNENNIPTRKDTKLYAKWIEHKKII